MWSNDREIEFLECYQNEPVIWDPKHLKHKNKQFIHDAWVRISNMIDIPIEELKKKRDSLMATYRTHKRKIKASIQSGASADSVYKPIWFAFEFMDSFLKETVIGKKTINTEEQTPPTPESQNENSQNENSQNENTGNDGQAEHDLPQMPTIPRRRKNPIELEEAGKTMKEAMSSLNKVLNKPQQSEDDYDRYGKILANKLRKLSETESLQMMYEIDGLFIRRLPSIFPHNIQPSSASGYAAPYYQRRPSSTCTSYSEPARVQVSLPSTSPHNIRPSSSSGSYSVLRDTYEIATEPPTIRILSNQIVNQPIAPEISESNNISDILSRALYEA